MTAVAELGLLQILPIQFCSFFPVLVKQRDFVLLFLDFQVNGSDFFAVACNFRSQQIVIQGHNLRFACENFFLDVGHFSERKFSFPLFLRFRLVRFALRIFPVLFLAEGFFRVLFRRRGRL